MSWDLFCNSFWAAFDSPKAFPCIIMLLYFFTILRYLFAKNYGQAMYWFFAMGITFTVTFLIKH